MLCGHLQIKGHVQHLPSCVKLLLCDVFIAPCLALCKGHVNQWCFEDDQVSSFLNRHLVYLLQYDVFSSISSGSSSTIRAVYL